MELEVLLKVMYLSQNLRPGEEMWLTPYHIVENWVTTRTQVSESQFRALCIGWMLDIDRLVSVGDWNSVPKLSNEMAKPQLFTAQSQERLINNKTLRG